MRDSRSDEDLMTAYQLGEAEAFAELYKRHAPRVFGFLRKKIRDEATARDIFQATFLKLHRSRAKYNPDFPFVPWLFTICRNELIDERRKAARKLESAVEKLPEPAMDFVSEEAAPEISLAVLPLQQRMALELRMQRDFSFEEIAAQLETSPANARQLVSRALKFLRNFYGRE